jgi:hypothetical protein
MRIALLNPVCPRFDALDLWLQRKSMTFVVKANGPECLIPHAPDARPELIYYGLLKAGTNQEQRKVVANAMRGNKPVSENDETEKYASLLIG